MTFQNNRTWGIVTLMALVLLFATSAGISYAVDCDGKCRERKVFHFCGVVYRDYNLPTCEWCKFLGGPVFTYCKPIESDRIINDRCEEYGNVTLTKYNLGTDICDCPPGNLSYSVEATAPSDLYQSAQTVPKKVCKR
jgi:hypothetical protein